MSITAARAQLRLTLATDRGHEAVARLFLDFGAAHTIRAHRGNAVGGAR